MTITLPNNLAKNYDVNSIMYKIVNGQKRYFRVDRVVFKKETTKFSGKKIKLT